MNANQIAKYGYIGVCIALYVAAGLVYLLDPSFLDPRFQTCCGAIMLAYGLVRIIGYFSKDFYCLAFQYDLALGILLMALGVITIVQRHQTESLYLTFGLLVLIDGLLRIQLARDGKGFGLETWKIILVLAIAASFFGCLMIISLGFSENVRHILFIAALVIDGIMNHFIMVTAVKPMRPQHFIGGLEHERKGRT